MSPRHSAEQMFFSFFSWPLLIFSWPSANVMRPVRGTAANWPACYHPGPFDLDHDHWPLTILPLPNMQANAKWTTIVLFPASTSPLTPTIIHTIGFFLFQLFCMQTIENWAPSTLKSTIKLSNKASNWKAFSIVGLLSLSPHPSVHRAIW